MAVAWPAPPAVSLALAILLNAPAALLPKFSSTTTVSRSVQWPPSTESALTNAQMAQSWLDRLVNLVTVRVRPVKVLPLPAQPVPPVSSATKAAAWEPVLPIPSPVAVPA